MSLLHFIAVIPRNNKSVSDNKLRLSGTYPAPRALFTIYLVGTHTQLNRSGPRTHSSPTKGHDPPHTSPRPLRNPRHGGIERFKHPSRHAWKSVASASSSHPFCSVVGSSNSQQSGPNRPTSPISFSSSHLISSADTIAGATSAIIRAAIMIVRYLTIGFLPLFVSYQPSALSILQ